MKTIYKYTLNFPGRTVLDLPAQARALTAQAQGDSIVIWFEVESAPSALERRTFDIHGTGWLIPDGENLYLATVQHLDGLVWHVYEVIS